MTTARDIDLRQLVEDRRTGASPDLLRKLLTMFVHALIGAEVDALCGAGDGQRSGERINARNGYRHRDFDTRVGTLDVAIPKLRQGSYFPDVTSRICSPLQGVTVSGMRSQRSTHWSVLISRVLECWVLGKPKYPKRV